MLTSKKTKQTGTFTMYNLRELSVVLTETTIDGWGPAGMLIGNDKIFLLTKGHTTGTDATGYMPCYSFSVDFSKNEPLTLIAEGTGDITDSNKVMNVNELNLSQGNMYAFLYKRVASVETNLEEIIGIKYKNTYYYKRGY